MAGTCHVNVKGAQSVVLEGCTHSSMLVFCFFSLAAATVNLGIYKPLLSGISLLAS